MRTRWIRRLFCMLVLVTWHTASAQTDAVTPIVIPPGARIGLVLSGGGARALAHAGVLRVLEAQGIHPDIITGTSMGSIIGALYASGRSAEEIDRIARNMNWREALSDSSPREQQLYPFRELEAGTTADLRMSITRKGFAFPRGAIEGQHLQQVLDDMFRQDGRSLQIETLPHRFAAVATDLETGAAVVLNRGDLVQAVRASMSIPGALAPVQRDGRLLVDGGMSDNMPVQLAQQMGATYIIAVDVSTPLYTREQLDSVMAVASQIGNFMVRLNTTQQHDIATQHGIVIVPELDSFGSTDFNRADEIIAAGVKAAQQSLRVPVQVAEQVAANTEPAADEQTPVINFIRIRNNSPVSDAVVQQQIHQKIGAPLDRASLDADLSRLYGLDYFRVVRYRVLHEGDQHGIEVIAPARENGNTWLKLGLELSDDFRGDSDFGLGASIRAAGLNRYGGTAFGSARLGTTPHLEARFLQPLDAALRYFVEPSLGARSEIIDIYADDVQDEPISRYRKNDYWGTLAAGHLVWQSVAELRAGIQRRHSDLDFHSGYNLSGENADSADDGFYFVRAGIDTLDDLGFPSRGVRASFTREQHETGLEAGNNFARNCMDFTLATHLHRNILLLEADAAISDSDNADLVDVPFIGGFLELSGKPPRDRFGRHRALVRTVYYHRMTDRSPLPIDYPVFVGASLEKGNVWLNRDNISWGNAISAGSIFIGAKTPLGPAYLSLGATNDGDRSISIFLGQRFR